MPFIKYNELLERFPLPVKSITSGIMYAGGDILAQYTETYTVNRNKPSDDQQTTTLDKKRVAIFFIYGTFIAGPAYHYWFDYLNELPALLWRFKQTRHRGKILRAYAYLKSHGIDVRMDTSKLPQAAPLGKWYGKMAKIAADQLIFSSFYTLVFFMSIGCLTGLADRLEVNQQVKQAVLHRPQQPSDEKISAQIQSQIHSSDSSESSVVKEQRLAILNKIIASYIHDDQALLEGKDRSELPILSSDISNNLPNEYELEEINNILMSIKRAQLYKAKGLTWEDISRKSWQHTKNVYVETYLTDCVVWPPLQLINFTFVPVRFQFLFVNFANLAWNTFLSLMANKKH